MNKCNIFGHKFGNAKVRELSSDFIHHFGLFLLRDDNILVISP